MAVDAMQKFREDVLSGRLDRRIALECFLLVKLGVRKLAIVTIPAELPDGDVLGAQVDFEFRGRIAGRARDMKTRLQDTIDRKRLSPLAFKAKVLRSSFEKHVLGSESYKAHRDAARSIGLEVQESEVRPTIREWYVSLPENRDLVYDLLKRRHEIQKQYRLKAKPSQAQAVAYYVYPEERDPEHLRSLGALLGYPSCCIEEYMAGRLAGDGTENIPEERAAKQLKGDDSPDAGDSRAHGSAESGHLAGVSEAAFWVKDFFPCRPDCPEAEAKAAEARQALALVDPRFADDYDELRRENLARVKGGPEAIRLHTKWLSRHQ